MSSASTYIGRNRPTAWRHLLAAMRDDALTPPATDSALQSLLEDAERNELAPNVAHSLLRGGDTRSEVKGAHDAAQQRIHTMLAAADDVAAVLADAGIPTLALKNVGIARAIYPCAACTQMGDIDLVVRRSDFLKAHDLLTGHGLVLDTRAPDIEPADVDHGYESGGCEYRYGEGEDQVWIELQWRPVSGRWIQPHQEPQAGGLIARSRPVDGSQLRLLDPTDNMLQVSLHTAKHSYCRAPGLRLHTDVHRLAEYDAPDWDRFLRKAHDLRVTTAVFFSLDIAHALLQSKIPRDILKSLAPNPTRRASVSAMLRRAGIFEPEQPKFSRPEMFAFHGLLYDNLRMLISSATGSSPEDVRLANLGAMAAGAKARLLDLSRNFQQ